jgi:hypothetical protein
MDVDVVTQGVIQRPRGEVASYVADPDNAPRWYKNIKSVEWKSPRPLAVGSLVEFVAHFLGRRLRYIYEITEYIPGGRLVMRTAQGPFPMETTYTWEDAGPGTTRMTLRNRGRPASFSRIFAPVMAMAIRRANRNDMAQLRNLLERR